MANKKAANLPDLPPFIPSKIRKRAELMEQFTGTKPSIEQLDRNRWRILLSGPRLTLEAIETFRLGKPVGYLYESTLMVDGEPREWVSSYEELGQLWENLKDPDYVYDPYFMVPDLPEMAKAEDVPPYVGELLDKMNDRLSSLPSLSGIEASLWPEDGCWVLGINAREAKTFSRLFLEIDECTGKWRLAKTLLVANGRDRTREMGQTIESALMATMQAMHSVGAPAPGGSGPVSKGSSAPRVAQQSVRDHKSTVIRV